MADGDDIRHIEDEKKKKRKKPCLSSVQATGAMEFGNLLGYRSQRRRIGIREHVQCLI